LRLALIGYGNVARAFAGLLEAKRGAHPFMITGAMTRRGFIINQSGILPDPVFVPAQCSVESFLAECPCDAMVELSTLSALDGEPAASHIRAAFARGLHVVTANKGPLAYACHELREQASARGLHFLFESVVMDGAPVFNLVRHALPQVSVLGFAGALNATSQIVLAAMERGLPLEEGVQEAQRLGIAEADPWYDLEGWDSACKAAALANVLMDARITPQQTDRKGIARLTPEKLAGLEAKGKRVALISRAHRGRDGVKLRVRAEVLERGDILANSGGRRSILVLETDLMGRIGVFADSPQVEQTAYGVYADLLEIARVTGAA
jgi:homoserine dehydrogenase